MINWDQIRQLEEDVGSEDLGEVVTLFLTEVEEAVDELHNVSLDTGTDVAEALHFLKGSAFNLGFQAFGDLCSEGEAAALGGSPMRVSFEEIAALYGASKSEFLADASQYCSLEF